MTDLPPPSPRTTHTAGESAGKAPAHLAEGWQWLSDLAEAKRWWLPTEAREWAAALLAERADAIGEDALHVESPWLTGTALCGESHGFNFVTLADDRPDSIVGCWTCLYAAEWLDEQSAHLPAAVGRSSSGVVLGQGEVGGASSAPDGAASLREVLTDWLDKPHRQERWEALVEVLGEEWRDVENLGRTLGNCREALRARSALSDGLLAELDQAKRALVLGLGDAA